MRHPALLATGLIASTLVAGLSVAASNNSSASGANPQPESNAAPNNAPANDTTDQAGTRNASYGNAAVNQDFGRLSSDGASAFADIHLARVAIFDGNTNLARKLISDAQSSLDKAKNDDTSFMKAESEMKAPSTPTTDTRPAQTKNTQRIAWLPIDGQLIVGETYKPSADKTAALSTARKNLRNGQTDQAMKAIRLAAVDVDYTMALAPLQQSIADVDQANTLMDSKDYYGASQALRQAEAGIRYDEIDDVANVKGGNAKTAAATTKNSG
jgi:hypothetical protein